MWCMAWNYIRPSLTDRRGSVSVNKKNTIRLKTTKQLQAGIQLTEPNGFITEKHVLLTVTLLVYFRLVSKFV